MNRKKRDEIRDFWDSVAVDWDLQVGNDGDNNRRLNSDPVLWRLAGDVKGLQVLDAGCGTGYLSRQLKRKGASVTGVDLSERMISIARNRSEDIEFLVESCAQLQGLSDTSFDLLIANYVLMDVADLQGTVKAFYRVLKPGGAAVVVFSHPCFPQAGADVNETDSVGISYQWNFNYFENSRRVDPPWGHFRSDFIWFHRPLSHYFKVFLEIGFTLTDFEEPHITPERYHLATNNKLLRNSRTRPYSVAFRLVKNKT